MLSDLAPAIEVYALGNVGQVKSWQEQATAEFSLETFRRWVGCLKGLAPNLLKMVRQLLAEIKPGWRYEKDARLFKPCLQSAKAELYQFFVLRDYFDHLIAREDYLPWLIFLRSTQFRADRRGLKRDNDRAGPKRKVKKE